MRRSFRGKNIAQAPTKEFRVNEKIFSPQLMIIDENGQNLGVLSKEDALAEARNRGFDLIEVSPKAVPPIAKFMNYGNYKYQKEKSERKQKAKTKTIEVKTIKLSFRISQHDIDIRMNQAIKFLDNGDKVRFEMQLRGRENQHSDIAAETIKKLVNDISELKSGAIKTEQPIAKVGNKFSTIITL